MATIALVGNPNSGKTTLFNALTGATQFVGNWPGVTVERKEGKFKLTKGDLESTQLVDLPGIYSLSPYSMEEVIARDYIMNQKPDVVINIVDASNLERNLYLTTQVLELGVPVVVALNMCDVVKKKGEKIDANALSEHLGCPVVEISAVKKTGIKELKAALNNVVNGTATIKPCSFKFSEDIEKAIEGVKEKHLLEDAENTSYGALKVLSNDEAYLKEHEVSEEALESVKEVRDALEAKYEDDFDSIIAEGRYQWINSIINSVLVERRKEKLSLSDKIDKVITNKWLGLPIFLGIIYLIYFICLNPKGLGKWLVGQCFTGVINLMVAMTGWLTQLGCSAWLVDLVTNGIIFGVGIVVAFVPYLMVLFLFLALLEESGYMARVAFIMDRLFRRFGLSGKSFIPMLLGTGCTVQAIASCRTIENEDDRRMTIFLAPFMPCATKMPAVILTCCVITGSEAAAAWIAPLIYVLAISFIIIAGLFLKKFKFTTKPAPFVMELPEYKIPTIGNVCHYIWSKTVSFFRKVSTIILISTVVVWFLKYFTFSFTHSAPDLENSMLASIGKYLCPLFAPMGLDNWKLIAASLTGYVAKDNVIGTLGTIMGASATNFDEQLLLFRAAFAGNIPQAVSFLSFFLLSSPCFASMGAISKELGNRKLTWQAIGFQMGSAYIITTIIYHILRLFMVSF